MKFAIDMRSSQDGIGGVPEYTAMITYHCAQLAREHDFVLFYSGLHVQVPDWVKEINNVRAVVNKESNKFFNAGIYFFGQPRLDIFLKKAMGMAVDTWFFPNLNFIALSPSMRSVVTIHDVSFNRYDEFYSKKQRWWHSAVRPAVLLTRAQKIIAVSQHTKTDVITEFGIPESKIAVTQLSYDTSFEVPSMSPTTQIRPSGRSVVTYAGGNPRKNFEVIIAGFVLLRQSLPGFEDVSLHIVGKRGRWIKDALRGCPAELQPYVHFHDGLSRGQTISLMQSASAFVYPSFYEGFGLPLLEAMSAGVPVITSPNSAMLETAHDAVFFSDPYNPHAMARALAAVLSNTALRSRLKEKGNARAHEYSWNKTAAQTLAVLEQAAQAPLSL